MSQFEKDCLELGARVACQFRLGGVRQVRQALAVARWRERAALRWEQTHAPS